MLSHISTLSELKSPLAAFETVYATSLTWGDGNNLFSPSASTQGQYTSSYPSYNILISLSTRDILHSFHCLRWQYASFNVSFSARFIGNTLIFLHPYAVYNINISLFREIFIALMNIFIAHSPCTKCKPAKQNRENKMPT